MSEPEQTPAPTLPDDAPLAELPAAGEDLLLFARRLIEQSFPPFVKDETPAHWAAELATSPSAPDGGGPPAERMVAAYTNDSQSAFPVELPAPLADLSAPGHPEPTSSEVLGGIWTTLEQLPPTYLMRDRGVPKETTERPVPATSLAPLVIPAASAPLLEQLAYSIAGSVSPSATQVVPSRGAELLFEERREAADSTSHTQTTEVTASATGVNVTAQAASFGAIPATPYANVSAGTIGTGLPPAAGLSTDHGVGGFVTSTDEGESSAPFAPGRLAAPTPSVAVDLPHDQLASELPEQAPRAIDTPIALDAAPSAVLVTPTTDHTDQDDGGPNLDGGSTSVSADGQQPAAPSIGQPGPTDPVQGSIDQGERLENSPQSTLTDAGLGGETDITQPSARRPEQDAIDQQEIGRDGHLAPDSPSAACQQTAYAPSRDGVELAPAELGAAISGQPDLNASVPSTTFAASAEAEGRPIDLVYPVPSRDHVAYGPAGEGPSEEIGAILLSYLGGSETVDLDALGAAVERLASVEYAHDRDNPDPSAAAVGIDATAVHTGDQSTTGHPAAGDSHGGFWSDHADGGDDLATDNLH